MILEREEKKTVAMDEDSIKLNQKQDEQMTDKNTMETKSEDIEDDEHACKDKILQKYFLQEWNVVKSIIDDIVSIGHVADISSAYKIRTIVISLSFSNFWSSFSYKCWIIVLN